jgi:hypothetical protein
MQTIFNDLALTAWRLGWRVVFESCAMAPLAMDVVIFNY